MREIELKVLEINKKDIIKKLNQLGAKSLGRHFVVAKRFDFKNEAITKRGDLFRIRTVGKTAMITYKKFAGKNKKYKIMDEFETDVGNFKTLEKILGLLGFVCATHHEKWRASFKFNGVSCEIDEYPGIPPYLEIEGPPHKIRTTLAALNIPFKNTTNLTAPKVLKKYGVNPNFLKLNFNQRLTRGLLSLE